MPALAQCWPLPIPPVFPPDQKRHVFAKALTGAVWLPEASVKTPLPRLLLPLAVTGTSAANSKTKFSTAPVLPDRGGHFS
ncbi:MAG: hypothetical protein BCS36_09255 [Desulfovibrio sp. MES5]|nr:MAG: hypothetical protein BCS36_09255 [Desulfovibrio sp. MES5]